MLQKALIVDKIGSAKLKTDALIIDPGPDEILIKVEAVAVNPIDYKVIDKFGLPGNHVGCDYAGSIIKVGAAVKRAFRPGDRVAGMIQGGNILDPLAGAFAEYAVAIGDVQIKIPDFMTFEEAASLGTAVNTATQGLYQHLKVPLPLRYVDHNYFIFIYGGSTTIGTMTIQFAKLSGLTVVTTCSPKNYELVKNYGADFVFDYHDSSSGAKIRSVTRDSLSYIFDCISDNNSITISNDAMGRFGGIYISTRAHTPLIEREDIKTIKMIAFTSLGKQMQIAPGAPIKSPCKDHRILAESLVPVVEENLKVRKLRAHPVTVEEGGLGGVLDGIDKLRSGNVSGVKLVYRINDKP